MILPELDPPKKFGAEQPWLQSTAGSISRLGFDGTFGTRRRGRLRCGIDLKKQPLTHWAWVEMKTLLVSTAFWSLASSFYVCAKVWLVDPSANYPLLVKRGLFENPAISR